ncbi:hypothetical protein HPP92_029109, partial [Vanilla planifolia]
DAMKGSDQRLLFDGELMHRIAVGIVHRQVRHIALEDPRAFVDRKRSLQIRPFHGGLKRSSVAGCATCSMLEKPRKLSDKKTGAGKGYEGQGMQVPVLKVLRAGPMGPLTRAGK